MCFWRKMSREVECPSWEKMSSHFAMGTRIFTSLNVPRSLAFILDRLWLTVRYRLKPHSSPHSHPNRRRCMRISFFPWTLNEKTRKEFFFCEEVSEKIFCSCLEDTGISCQWDQEDFMGIYSFLKTFFFLIFEPAFSLQGGTTTTKDRLAVIWYSSSVRHILYPRGREGNCEPAYYASLIVWRTHMSTRLFPTESMGSFDRLVSPVITLWMKRQ